jgi:hypothetical protein
MNYNLLQQISNFYERYECIGLRITFVLIYLQVIHLFWLTTFVILDAPQFTLGIPPIVFAAIDYLEIPALISGMVFYILSLHTHRNKKDILFVALLGVQFFHILWITDAFVYMSFKFNAMTWLAWIAVFVDFLEVPIIIDLFIKIIRSKRKELTKSTR